MRNIKFSKKKIKKKKKNAIFETKNSIVDTTKCIVAIKFSENIQKQKKIRKTYLPTTGGPYFFVNPKLLTFCQK